MSVEALAICLHHSTAAGTAKLVLLGIANHHGDGGAWPSVATLARYANASERTVQRALNDLLDLGEITIAHKAGLGEVKRQYKTNRYQIALACPPGCDRTTAHRIGQATQNPEVTPMSPLGASEVTPMSPLEVTPMSPEPSLEPKPPYPPAGKPAGGTCSKHPNPRPNCRACGTTERQQAHKAATDRARASATAQRQALDQERQRRAALLSAPISQTEANLRAAARQALRGHQ
jgi:hypothetical protein